MSTTTLTPALPAILPPLPVRRFTVDEYHRMIETGILGEEDAVELLEGWIVPKMPRKPLHDATVSWIGNRVLSPRLPQGWCCRCQCAVTTAHSEPEPDLTVARGSELDYRFHHPGPADMALVIEVADSSLPRDRQTKARIYARAGVPVYWIINLVDGLVEVFTDPTGPVEEPSYRTVHIFERSESVPLVIDDQDLGLIPTTELLP